MSRTGPRRHEPTPTLTYANTYTNTEEPKP